MASDLTVGLDMIAAATVPTKPAARLLWGVVASTASPVQVVLENDTSATSRPVSGNASGPVAMGDRVLLARQRRRLTIVANPTAQARLMADTGWVNVAPSTGFTGTLRVRRVGPLAEVDCNLTGTIPVGATVLASAVPALYQPVGSPSRIEALANGYPVSGYVSAGTLGVSQQTGASRTGVAMRGVWVAI